MNKPQLNLQDTFLNQARKENIGVTIYLVNSIKLQGHVRGFDAFTILLDTPGKPPQLVYKHSVTSIVPMRPIQHLFAEAMREAGMQPQQQGGHNNQAPQAPPVHPTHPDASVTVQQPRPAPTTATPDPSKLEPIS
jgi:host factor-I protein